MNLPFSCPNCHRNKTQTLFNAPDFDGQGDLYTIYQCEDCQLAWANPRPSEDELADLYSGEYYGGATSKFAGLVEKWTIHAAKKRAKKLLNEHAASSEKLRILDIGCGRGVLLNAFLSLGHDAVGLERPGSPFCGMEKIVCSELSESGFSENSFDIVVLWHVLEHLSDPARTLLEVEKLLKKDGSIFISVPNFGSYQARLFKKHWFHLDLPRHIYHFNHHALQKTLNATGLEISKLNTWSIDQNVYGFLQSLLNVFFSRINNHLYSLLKGKPDIRRVFLLILYLPIATPFSVLAIIELLLSELRAKGASLNIKAVKNTHAQQ